MKLVFAAGINENEDTVINELECSDGQNFELGIGRSSFRPRAPIDLKGTATNAGAIRGLLQLVKRDNTETTLAIADTKAYLWDGASSFTEQGTNFVTSGSKLRSTYWELGQYLIITDLEKTTTVSQWDGTTLSTQTHGISGVTDLYAKYGVVKDGRVWLFNVKTDSSDTPHLMVASTFEDPTVYDTAKRAGDSTFTTGNEPFYMLTPDLKEINGVVLLNKELIVSTEGGRLFRLMGNDSTNYAWVDYYAGSEAIGDESIVSIGNDVVYVRRGGNIDLFSTTQTSGDVRADDISRFIPTTVANLTGAMTVYDQQNQKALFFTSDKVLVLFKDLISSGLSPWGVYVSNDSHGMNTEAAQYMKRPGTDEYSVYFGDSSGNIYDLNGSGVGDDGTDIETIRVTKVIEVDDTQLIEGRIQYRRKFEMDFSITLDWSETYGSNESVIKLKGDTAADQGNYYSGTAYASGDTVYNGNFYYNQGFKFSEKISTQGFTPVGTGISTRITMYISASRAFQIDNISL